MAEWVIVYRKRRGREEKLVVMPTLSKLLKWIEKHGSECSECRIFLSE